MSDLRLGDFVTYTMPADAYKEYVRNGIESPWIERSDEQHLAIVIQFLDDEGAVRVWDTVESEWWIASESTLSRVRVA